MPTITKTIAVPAKGIGRPDYSGEQWQAKVIKRLELHENEVIKAFYLCPTTSWAGNPYVWVVAPLAIGVPTYLIDQNTGFPMPYFVATGYQLEVMMIWASFNQNIKFFTEFEGFRMSEYYHDALNVYYENEVLEYGTQYIDPDALFPHLAAFGGENVGLDVMSGLAEVLCILRAVHTEIPTSKTIRCKWCGNTTSVANEVVRWKCTKCGGENLYFHYPSALTRGRR